MHTLGFSSFTPYSIHGSKEEEIKGLVEIFPGARQPRQTTTANTHGIQTLQKMVYVIGVSDMATLSSSSTNFKDIPRKLQKTLLSSALVLKSAREENIIEVSSDFQGSSVPSLCPVWNWIRQAACLDVSVFKNEPLGIEVKDFLALFSVSRRSRSTKIIPGCV